MLWLTVHLWYLIGFQNRLIVVIRWTFHVLAHGRAARLITGEQPWAPEQLTETDASPAASLIPAHRIRSMT